MYIFDWQPKEFWFETVFFFGMVEDPHRADGKQQRLHEVLTKNEIKFSFLGSETTFTGWLTSTKLNCVLYTFISRQQFNEIE